MNTPDRLNVRIDPEFVKRCIAVAERDGRTYGGVVAICLREFLPVIEAGVYNSPGWEGIKQTWSDDVQALIKVSKHETRR
jgi:hypothetical protein